jgi:hypothetical protein
MGGRNQSTRRETCDSATLFTINPKRTILAFNPGLRTKRPATNNLLRRHIRGVELQVLSSLTSALDGCQLLAPRPAVFHLRNNNGTRRTGGWVGSRAGFDVLEKNLLHGIRARTVHPVAHSLPPPNRTLISILFTNLWRQLYVTKPSQAINYVNLQSRSAVSETSVSSVSHT